MEQQIVLRGDEAVALATELATLTGKSLETAVTEAVRDSIKLELERRAEVERILAIGKSFRILLGDDAPSLNIDSLYDPDTGLPA